MILGAVELMQSQGSEGKGARRDGACPPWAGKPRAELLLLGQTFGNRAAIPVCSRTQPCAFGGNLPICN